ncbi:DNA (Cytosine-5-)-methyltransferase [uncultured Sporomusa sp.]|uniref:DNA (Cytosine-5-)-methyltransferase n=1 Tax=uncultured Sporomusa sp. TaxID=307249 RepID=A0A212LY78_9FIRM|nr:site-specific DNA-methyltransferase [uncultured Sporomusa sp.]SCM82554.1 DNA (Cytosine-5-)-methyltransferase [uncultured Sporomusa sp.]
MKQKILASDLNELDLLDKEDLIKVVKKMVGGGVSLMFHGKRTAHEIQRLVRPRSTRIVPALCFGTAEEQAKNFIYEGENLQAMVTLYKYRGQVDLIVTDPPYNTGNDFRYNDRWDEDPNDPDLGHIVPEDDGSRHTKWLRFMTPRILMMREMLKSKGVIAICIDHRELFRLGMLMDEVFGEENRLGIINWQKSYSPKSGSKHISSATEYVLIYSKDIESVKTGLLSRTESMNAKYKNPDNDPEGLWRSDNPIAKDYSFSGFFGIQSPFTGELHYPTPNSHWRYTRKDMKRWLEQWGSKYIEIADSSDAFNVQKSKAIVLDGTKFIDGCFVTPPQVLQKASETAKAVLAAKNCWPFLFFMKDGMGRPSAKRYLNKVKQGTVPLTYWANDEYDEPFFIEAQSWSYEQSGHSQTGITELDAICGPNHGFETVKPLKLIKKIIQLWCPADGLVVDPFAGSGTTGHAILELNYETNSARRFILIEQGSPEKGDKYARTLTCERIRRAITGERPLSDGTLQVVADPLGGGFEFRQLLNQIDAKAVLSMKREELIDVILTSHWDEGRRSGSSFIQRLDGYCFLAGKNPQNEGYFIIWNGAESVGQLDTETYGQLLKEAKKAGIKAPYHVYARYELYQSRSVIFYKIPDKILAHLGLNEYSERYNDTEGCDDK